MPSIIRQYSSGDSPTSSRESKSRHSSVVDAVAFSSQSTAPTSMSGSPRIPESKHTPSPPLPATAPLHPPAYRETPRFQPSYEAQDEDLSPLTNCYPRSSVDTYVSGTESEEALEQHLPDGAFDITDDDEAHHYYGGLPQHSTSDGSIPALPEYRHDIVDNTVRPSTPQEFAQLFPSLNRMSIRHDEFTADGNMNLRVDVAVPVGSRRRLTSYQLFHLRMYDLAKREFSLRRYSRDSGREVCNSKLTFIDPAEKKHRIGRISRKTSEDSNLKHWGRSSTTSSSGSTTSQTKASPADVRPTLQRSMTSALRSLGAMATKPSFRRAHTSDSSARHHNQQRPATSHWPYSGGHADGEYTTSPARPSLSSSSTPSLFGREKGHAAHLPPAPKPTNTIKLEFSNYARVDIARRGGSSGSNGQHDNTRYEFDWWGHKYTWKRSTEKHLNVVSYHLLRDDNGEQAIAHIVPEMRSPNQVEADEDAGGWIPPCHMWISHPSVLEVMTDVADVIVSTGLIALADDCIRTRWQPRKTHGISMPLLSRTLDIEHVGPRALMQHVFHRRNSHGSNGTNASTFASSPLRHAEQTY